MVLLLALDLPVIPKAQDLLTNEALEETQTKTREEESTLSYKEKKGMLKDDIDLVITCILSELKDLLEDPFDDHDHDISLSSTSKCMLYYKVYLFITNEFS